MFRIYIQTASAANYNQSSIRAGEDVAQVLQRGAVLGKCFLRPRSERVNHHVKALQVSSSQVEQILFQNLLGHGGIVSTNNGGHIQTSVYGFLYDELTSFSVCTNHCKFHFEFLLICWMIVCFN